MGDETTVVVATFSTQLEADLAWARLEAEGVPCTVFSDDAGGAFPMLQVTRGVKVLVASDNEARAREILGSPHEVFEDSEFTDEPPGC